MGKNKVTYSDRAFKQDASEAMRGDIVRGLIEAITNCDDAYGDDPGKIRVEVEHRRGRPWKVVVRDRGPGMRAKKMKTAIGGLGVRASGFEEGKRVRGNLGRGAKDLAAFGPVTFESVCDGRYSRMVLEPDGTYDDPIEHDVTDEELESLGIRRTGTVVSVDAQPTIRCPQHLNLLQKLGSHYQLRDINSDHRREVTLVDLNSGREDTVRYSRPSLEQVDSVDLDVEGYPGAVARLTIWRNPECYANSSSDPGRPEGILIAGSRAIYENTLFSLEASPYAGWFSGRLECRYIDDLARDLDEAAQNEREAEPENPIPIISRSRDGLRREHPFYKLLAEAVESRLEPLIRAEEEKARSGAGRESVKMRRTLDSLGRDLGKLVDDDLRELDEDGIGGPGDDEEEAPLRIVPESVVVYMGDEKTLTVIVARSLGVDEVEAEVDPEGVVELVDGSKVPLSDHPRRDEYLVGQVRVRPLLEDDETFVTVDAGEHETSALIEVRSERVVEPEAEPPTTFSFERGQYHFTHGKRRKVRLRAPLQEVEKHGPVVHVRSTSEGIVVSGRSFELELDEDGMYFNGVVEVDPREYGASGSLIADLGPLEAACSASVGSPGSGPQLEIVIEPNAAGNYRALVDTVGDRTRMEIQGLHPAIKRYLGPAPDFPNQDTVEAKTVLAEIIANEAARMIVEKKFQDAGELHGANFYSEHRRYLERYLARCHRLMIGDTELS